MKSRNTSATYADFVHDVTSTKCQTTKWQRSRSCFVDFERTVFKNKLDCKSTGKTNKQTTKQKQKTNCCERIFYSIVLVWPVRCASSFGVLLKRYQQVPPKATWPLPPLSVNLDLNPFPVKPFYSAKSSVKELLKRLETFSFRNQLRFRTYQKLEFAQEL